MPVSLTTDRLNLPLLAAGQAQKELTHNEAITKIDALLFPRAELAGLNTPPTTPLPGQCWLLGATPTADWAGMAFHLALWTSAGWRFSVLPLGSRVAVGANQTLWTLNASGWQVAAAITSPTAGTTIDVECRAAVTALLQALRSIGIIAEA
ncbi:MAG: DUF2793 domain-containing protein [Sphingopyxis sp.]